MSHTFQRLECIEKDDLHFLLKIRATITVAFRKYFALNFYDFIDILFLDGK